MPSLNRRALLAVAAGAPWLAAGRGRAAAQEATPVAGGGVRAPLAPGVEIAYLGLAPAVELPPGSNLLALLRLTIEPDAAFALDGRDRGTTLFLVEAGSLTGRFDAEVRRTPAPGAVPLLVPEPVDVGTAVRLEPGDGLEPPPLAAGELRNEGATEAVVLAASVTPSGMPATPPAATPTG